MLIRFFFISILISSAIFAKVTKRDMLIISTTMGKTSQASKAYSLTKEAKKQNLMIDFKFEN